MLSKIGAYLKNEEISIKDRGFAFNTLAITSMLIVTFIARIIVNGFTVNASAVLVTIILFAVNGYLSITKNKMERGAVIMCAILGFYFFPVMFLTGGGIVGDAPVWFIYTVVLFIISLRTDKQKRIFTIVDFVLAVILYLIAVFSPKSVIMFSKNDAYLLSFITLIFASCNMVVIVANQSRLVEQEQKKSEEQKKEIEGLVTAQNRFFSSMSHEIRTPINTIIGLNEMILREDISDEIAEDAVNIRAASKMLLNTINDILDMSKFQSGDMKLLLDTYNTGNMLSEIVGMLWIRAKEKNLDFHINVAPDIPSELRGDEVRIKQVLMNILNNAIKYTKEGSISLTVECEAQEDNIYNIIYTVEDTGMGIKKEDIPYLFTAFKRVDEDNTKHIEGTGLGLSIVKQFLDLMGGKVTVNSVYTKGSTFVIEIPQKAVSDKEIGEYDYEKKHKVHNRQSYSHKFEAPNAKILVIDDNESNLLVVTKLLRDTKIQIDTAKNGVLALEKTLDKEYDLIFMDHLMPEMDGVECFRNIRKQVGGKNRETKIVILTANAGEENRIIYAREGFNGYVVKPVTGEDLENEVFRQLPQHLIRVIDSTGMESGETVSWMNDIQRKRRITVTTDSTANLSKELLDKYKISAINHKIKTEAGIFKEGVDIDTAGLMQYMADSDKEVSVYPPLPDEYEKFFADTLATSNNVIHICTSKDLDNRPYENAMEAAKSFDNVTVFDSRHFGCGQGLVALFTCRMVEAGMSVEEIIFRLGHLKDRVRSSFMVDNLDYLARANQVSPGYANFMKSLMLRPVCYVKNGQVGTAGILFGSSETVWKKYIDKALSGGKLDSTVIFVSYVGLTKKETDFIREHIEKKWSFDKVVFLQTCPVVAVSFGPGSFSINVVEEG